MVQHTQTLLDGWKLVKTTYPGAALHHYTYNSNGTIIAYYFGLGDEMVCKISYSTTYHDCYIIHFMRRSGDKDDI